MQDVQDFISSQTPHSHLIYSLRSAFPRFARKSYSDARFARILVAPLEIKDLIFKLDCKVRKGKRNDKMTRKAKYKAYLQKI